MSFLKTEFAFVKLSKVKEFAVKYSKIFLIAVLCLTVLISIAVLEGSIKVFDIFDGKTTKTVRTISGSLPNVLNCINLSEDDYRVLSVKNNGNRTDVTIGYTFPVYIAVGDKSRKVITTEKTVYDILTEAGFTVDEYDLVEPSADTVISGECYISYSDVSFETGSYTEAIPCSLETVYSNNREKGNNTIVQGTDGLKQIFYTAKIVNGETVDMSVNNSVVLSDAINGKQIIGTAVPKSVAVSSSNAVASVSTLKPNAPIELDANGVPCNYKEKRTVQATGYTYTGNNCSTGVPPQPGYIAVNPKVIPYGTKMYIKSSDGSVIYGYAVAADTGGFIKSRPNNVDLFFTTVSACKSFGRRNVEIYILE